VEGLSIEFFDFVCCRCSASIWIPMSVVHLSYDGALEDRSLHRHKLVFCVHTNDYFPLIYDHRLYSNTALFLPSLL